MKSKKIEKIMLLSEFVKKFKKEHPELTKGQATKKARAEYKKYIKDIRQKRKDEKDLAKLEKECIGKDMKD